MAASRGWVPETEDDLRGGGGQPAPRREHRSIELKREVGLPGRRTNAELARDLASLAVEGGLFLVSVDEPQDGGLAQLRPVPLEGLSERVEQVALTRATHRSRSGPFPSPQPSTRASAISSCACRRAPTLRIW